MRLYAVRDMVDGEEITTSYYGGNWESSSSRRAHLSADYGFECQCKCCTDADASDARRTRLRTEFDPSRLSFRLNEWVRTGDNSISKQELLEEVEDGLQLYAQEGLESHSSYPTFLLHVCLVLRDAMGVDDNKFQLYGLMLLRLWTARGMSTAKILAMFEMLMKPLHGVRDDCQ